MVLEVIPVLRLLGRSAVFQSGKIYKRIKRKPVELVKELSQPKIYVLDLNGILKNKPELEVIKKLSQVKALWVDAGVKRPNDLIDMLVAGAEEVVINLSTLNSIENLEYCIELSSNLVLSVEYNERRELVSNLSDRKLSELDLSSIASSHKLDKLILKMEAQDLGIIERLAARNLKPYVWCTRDQLEKIKSSSAKGALIDFSEVLKWSY